MLRLVLLGNLSNDGGDGNEKDSKHVTGLVNLPFTIRVFFLSSRVFSCFVLTQRSSACLQAKFRYSALPHTRFFFRRACFRASRSFNAQAPVRRSNIVTVRFSIP